MKFPKVLHVTIEEYENSDPGFLILEGGVDDAESHDQRVAVYELVSEGKVKISKTLKFVQPKRGR